MCAATCHILDKLTVGTRWANGDHLVNFASANRLVVSSTRFQHPQHHLVARFSNDGRTRNQINHMLVLCRCASSVIDFRASSGAQTGSEHLLQDLRNRFDGLQLDEDAPPGGRMARAQRRGPRRFLGTSMKSVPSPSGLGHWRNDCVG